MHNTVFRISVSAQEDWDSSGQLRTFHEYTFVFYVQLDICVRV
jgi:hypothetical protein